MPPTLNCPPGATQAHGSRAEWLAWPECIHSKGDFFFPQTPRNLDTSTSNQLYFSPNSPLLLPEEGYVKAPHRSGWRNHLQQNSYLIVLLFNSFCRKYRSLFPYSLQKHYLHLSNYVLQQERDLHWTSRSSPASNPAADPHIPLWYQ